ncbi:MAG: hypothetical protein AB7O04_10255 [Hyphomonadaceae bacterium]
MSALDLFRGEDAFGWAFVALVWVALAVHVAIELTAHARRKLSQQGGRDG